MKMSLAKFDYFSVDSRDVKPNTLFFALKGAKADGHSFLAEVAKRGAIAAVVDQSYQGPDFGLRLIPVENVLESLQALAREKIIERGVRVVGITGSVGKTTTKEFIATLLRQKYQVAASSGNSNSQIGLPLSILNGLQVGDQILVQEMGMTEPGNLKKLISIAPPEVAIITTITLVHACNFDSLKEIALTKGEILTHPLTKCAFLLPEFFPELSTLGTCRKVSYSTTAAADYCFSDEGEIFEKGELLGCVGPLPVRGDHNRQNLLGALAVARYFGLQFDEIAQGVQQLALPERRLQLVQKGGIQFVNDSYNACALSMKAALKSLPSPENGGKKIAVLGEMLELGKFSAECHQEVAEASLKAVDQMICFGEGCAPIAACWQQAEKPVMWTLNRDELMHYFRNLVKPGDVVLLKGSRAKQLWKVIDDL